MVLGVITGDIIGSRSIVTARMLPDIIRDVTQEIESTLKMKTSLEIFRGDSFQMVALRPADSMLLAIIMRAGLKVRSMRMRDPQKAHSGREQTGHNALLDARISVGIGPVDNLSERISESFGEAFTISGERLDTMKGESARITATASISPLNRELSITTALADTIISRWSLQASEAIFRQLLYGETQQDTAAALGISQPAVHNRLENGNYDQIRSFLIYFNALITEHYGTD